MTAPATDLNARAAVEDAVIRMFVATDERDWATLHDCFTDPFIVDMTSLVGGAPTSVTPQQVAQVWSEGFRHLDHVHHQIGNLRTRIEGDRAVVHCYGIALHHRAKAVGIRTRVFVGTYELELRRLGESWRISGLTFRLKFIDGNLQLEQTL